MTTSGSCLCGAITYEFTGEPAAQALCHCKDCQKWSGGPGTSIVVVPNDNFTIKTGTPKSYTTIGLDSKLPHPHFFCGDCGSSLYSQPESMAGVTAVRAGTLDNEASNIKPGIEFFAKDRRSYDLQVEGAKQASTMS